MSYKIFIKNIDKTTKEDFEKFLKDKFGKIDDIKYYNNRNIAYLSLSDKDIYDKMISTKNLKYNKRNLYIHNYIQKKHFLHIYNIPERLSFNELCSLFKDTSSIISISLDYNNKEGVIKNSCNITLTDFEEYKSLLEKKEIKLNDNEIIYITKRITKKNLKRR